MSKPNPSWSVGAAEIDITPTAPVFLYGYPHVERTSTGVHDPLLASALCVHDGEQYAAFVACDVIWVPRDVTRRARQRIAARCGLAAGSVMITATHTHSGPVTNRILSNEADEVVPEPDAAYLQSLEDGIVEAAVSARQRLAPAQLREAVIDASFLGTNRSDPAGPSIPTLPILAAFDETGEPRCVMAVCSMHPTVLHEDWTQVSGDFPGLARQRIQQRFGKHVPFVYHMGASGDQSPRHVVERNTIEQATRLGHQLGDAICTALEDAHPVEPVHIRCVSRTLDLPLRELPPVEHAEARRDAAKHRLDALRQRGESRTAIRTAEVDWFGAEETLTLARAARDGRIEQAAAECLPAEVQVIEVGDRRWVGWPGEVFVDFARHVMAVDPRAAVITLANGDVQGYLVTQDAIDQGAYEAGNAIFQSPDAGRLLVQATLERLQQLNDAPVADTASP